MVADQFKWSPVRATTGIDLFDKEHPLMLEQPLICML